MDIIKNISIIFSSIFLESIPFLLLGALISAIGTFIVSLLVSKFLARKIKKIDMVTSLKANE